jgi:hypothetical protein
MVYFSGVMIENAIAGVSFDETVHEIERIA